MAYAVRETEIANPARARGKARKNMAARHLSAKQIKAGFGGKRRQSALKSKRHAARSVPAKKRNVAKKAHRASNRPKPTKKKRNLGELVSILIPGAVGNPAKKRGHKTMAATKKHKKRASAQRNAGSRRHKKMNVSRRHSRRSNPGRVQEYLKAGVSVVGGAVLSKIGTQVVLGAKNTGFMGYGGNLVATGILGWAAHAMFKDKLVSQMVIAGGIAQVIVRAIGEQTPYGKYLAGAGVGDYQLSAFLTPQRSVNALRNAAIEQPRWSLAPPASVVVTHPATAAGVGNYQDWN